MSMAEPRLPLLVEDAARPDSEEVRRHHGIQTNQIKNKTVYSYEGPMKDR